ncbi:MAG: FAD:protein FMN transferase [Pirellulales bacterium]|nr:FAD:protein FMN transferase [Pirellulales bacterium]
MTISAGKPVRCIVWFGLVLLVGLPLAMVSWAPPVETGIVSFSGPTMGTHYKVRIAAQALADRWPPATDDIQQLVENRLAEINRLMSTYDPESELSRFNHSPSDGWFQVNKETARVVAYALEVAKKTEGAFDPTVGPVVNLWGFGPGQRRVEPPADAAVAQALQQVGYQNIAVRMDPPSLRKTNATTHLDLSAIAKGYAVDQVSELLQSQGIRSFMVDIGGEVRTSGTKPEDAPWRIAIEKPQPDREKPFQQVLELRDGTLATSGDYRNFFEQDGVRYSHTIDPQTGRPIQHRLAVVSVQAESCMEADALATALMVMGAGRGYDWCVKHEVAALFQVRVGQSVVPRATPRFEQLHQLPQATTASRAK